MDDHEEEAVMQLEQEEAENSLLDAAAVYAIEKHYPDGCMANRKRIIRKKAAKLVIINGEVFVKKKAGKVSH